MTQDHRLPEQVVRDLSEGLTDALSQSWPENADSTFAGAPQISINITAPPLPTRLIRFSKFAQCGLFAKGSEPSRAMLESAMEKNLLSARTYRFESGRGYFAKYKLQIYVDKKPADSGLFCSWHAIRFLSGGINNL